MIFRLMAACTALTFLTACSPSPPEKIGPGRVESGAFVHDALKMNLALPEQWTVLDQAAIDAIDRASTHEFGLGDPKTQAKVEQERADRTYLFVTRSPHAKGAAAMMGLTHRLNPEGEVTSARDYLERTRETLAKTTEMKVGERVDPVKLGNTDMLHFHTQLESRTADGQPLEIHQEYYATTRMGHAIGFILTWSDTQDRDTMTALTKLKLAP